MRIRSLAAVSLLCLASVTAVNTREQAPAAAPSVRVAQGSDALYRTAEQVASDVEKLRGWTFKRPVRKELATIAEARRYFESRIDVLLPPPRRAVLEAFLRTAGLIPPDADLRASLSTLLEQQVAGYYTPSTGTLYLVDRSDDMPPFLRRTVLAHELTHALDDQYVGLADLDKPDAKSTEDTDIVRGSLSEGSATALMFQYLVRKTMAGRVNAGEAADYFKKEMARAESLAQTPRYFNALFGSYLVGAAFLAKGHLEAVLSQPDNTAIGQNFLAAWKNQPRSSEQVLHPEKYWDASRVDEPVVVIDSSVERWLASAGQQVVHRDTLGEMLTALLTEPPNAPSPVQKLMGADGWTNEGAAGWGGDRFFLLASGSNTATASSDLKGLRGVWVTAWDTAKDRDEFATALTAGNKMPKADAARWGARVAIVFVGFDGADRERLLASLKETPLTFTQGGRRWSPQ